MTTHRCPTPLGLAEIATFLHVAPSTPTRWRYRRDLPDPDGYTSGTVPYWWDTTVEDWARRTGRWREDGPARITAEAERRRLARRARDLELEEARLRARQEALQAELAAAQAAREAALAAARAAEAAGRAAHPAALAG